jgi:hypothetical protein
MPLRRPFGDTTVPSIRAACVGAGASVTSTSSRPALRKSGVRRAAGQ